MQKSVTTALLASVEEEAIPYNNNNHKDDSVVDKDADTPRAVNTTRDQERLSLEAFVELFAGGTSSFMEEELSAKEQRTLLLNAIECFTPSQAQRFFGGLNALAKDVIARQDHVPTAVTSEQPNGDSAEPNNDDQALLYPDKILPDPHSSRAMQFLRLCALCTQTFLDEIVARKKKKHNNNTNNSQHKKDTPVRILEEAFDLAMTLHDSLFSLLHCGLDGRETQKPILKLCEAWWLANASNREYLVSQSLPLLIQSVVLNNHTAPKAELSRLYQMRHAISCIDFEDESSAWSRSILLRVASSPTCLKLPEGRRFLAFLFHADPFLISSLHHCMRAQIPTAKPSILHAYAEIYYRAWKDAPEPNVTEDEEAVDIRQQLELEVLADIVYTMIHVVKPCMFHALMTIMKPFFDNKLKPEVEDLLHRLLAPILWRSFTVSNAHVRLHATRVFGYVFPLHDSSHTQAHKHLTKACAALDGLLQDSDSQVRVAASTAVAQALTQLWEVIPSVEIHKLLDRIVTIHASDAGSPAVRAAALQAVSTLLSTPQSHAVLQPLLPPLGQLIHDKVEKVRLAAVQLLIQVKTVVPDLKYFQVVKAAHLRVRLAEEPRLQGPVASALTSLMLNSYLPQGVDPMNQISRTLAFLEKHPDTAAVFYQNLGTHTGVPVVTKLIVWLFKCLFKAVASEHDEPANNSQTRTRTKAVTSEEESDNVSSQTRKRTRRHTKDANRKSKRKRPPSPKQQDEDSETEAPPTESNKNGPLLPASNTLLLARVTETAALLWESMEPHLRKNAHKESQQYLEQYFVKANIQVLLEYVERKATICSESEDQQAQHQLSHYNRCRAALLQCASRMPSHDRSTHLAFVYSLLREVHESPHKTIYRTCVPAYVALLCHSDMESGVATSLASSISGFLDGETSGLYENPSPVAERRRGKGARGRAIVDQSSIPRFPPQLALESLATILQDSRPMFVQARQTLLCHTDIQSILRDALGKVFSYLSRMLQDRESCDMSDSNLEFALMACELYGKLNFWLYSECSKEFEDTDKEKHPVQVILSWVSSTVIPMMVAPDSRNPVNSPVAKDSILSPDSVESRGSRRRLTRSSAALDGNASMTKTFLRDNAEGAKTIKTTLESLFSWACCFLTEWTLLTKDDVPEMVGQTAEWCKILSGSEDYGTSTKMIRFPLRLAVAFSHRRFHSNQHFELLQHLLVTFDGKGEDFEDLFDKAISSLGLNRRSVKAGMAQKYAQCVSEVLNHVNAGQQSDDVAPALVDSPRELWPFEGSISAAIRVAWKSDTVRDKLFEMSSKFIESQGKLEESKSRVCLNLQLLGLLYDADRSSHKKEQLVESTSWCKDHVDTDISKLGSDLLESLN